MFSVFEGIILMQFHFTMRRIRHTSPLQQPLERQNLFSPSFKTLYASRTGFQIRRCVRCWKIEQILHSQRSNPKSYSFKQPLLIINRPGGAIFRCYFSKSRGAVYSWDELVFNDHCRVSHSELSHTPASIPKTTLHKDRRCYYYIFVHLELVKARKFALAVSQMACTRRDKLHLKMVFIENEQFANVNWSKVSPISPFRKVCSVYGLPLLIWCVNSKFSLCEFKMNHVRPQKVLFTNIWRLTLRRARVSHSKSRQPWERKVTHDIRICSCHPSTATIQDSQNYFHRESYPRADAPWNILLEAILLQRRIHVDFRVGIPSGRVKRSKSLVVLSIRSMMTTLRFAYCKILRSSVIRYSINGTYWSTSHLWHSISWSSNLTIIANWGQHNAEIHSGGT